MHVMQECEQVAVAIFVRYNKRHFLQRDAVRWFVASFS